MKNLTWLLGLALLLWGWGAAGTAWSQEAGKGGGIPSAEAGAIPEAAQKALMEAKTLVLQGKIDKAELKFQEATKLAPESDYIYGEHAKYYGTIKNYALAAECYKKALEIKPDNLDYRLRMAQAYTDAADYENAQEAWSSIAEDQSGIAEYKYKLAYVLMRRGKLDDASAKINEALELDTGNGRYLAFKAEIALYQARFQPAKELSEQAMEKLDPESDAYADTLRVHDDAVKGLRLRTLRVAMVTVAPIILLVGGFFGYRYMRRTMEKEVPLELDDSSVMAISRFLLTAAARYLDLPRGACWTPTLDGRFIEMQVSDLMGEEVPAGMLPMDRKAVDEWIAERGTKPFIYGEEAKSERFAKAFPDLAAKLRGVELNVGIPVVWKEEFLGLVIVGRSRSAKQFDIPKRLDQKAILIQDAVEQAAVALDRLWQKNLKVQDAVTGLWNRDYFEISLVDVFRGCRTAGIPLAVYMARLDQMSRLTESLSEEECNDVLYSIRTAFDKALENENNLTVCHLDNGQFGILAPERTEEQAARLAMLLKQCIDGIVVPKSNLKMTGLVAYSIYPADADDPKMLRAVCGRAFRDAAYLDGNRVVRAEKAGAGTETPDDAAVKESVPEIVVSRRVVPAEMSGVATVADRAAGADANINKPTKEELLNKDGSPVSALAGGVASKLAAGRHGASLAGGKKGGSAEETRKRHITGNSGGELRALYERKNAEGDSVLGEGADIDLSEFTIVPELDEYGMDTETQFCGQDSFYELMDYELNSADESGESCTVIYLHIHNLRQMRSFGRIAYMQLRRDLSNLVAAFLRDDVDVPGLVGEDDFAVFMIGTDVSVAKSLAEKISLTAANMEIKGVKMELAIGIALRKGEGVDAKALIGRAQRSAVLPGITVAGM